MKQIKFIGTIIMLAIMTVARGQSEQKNTQNSVPADWKTFEQSDYKISYPDSCTLDTSGVLGSSFVLLLSKPDSSSHAFVKNINLLIQDLKEQNVSLDDYVKLNEIQIKTMLTDGNIIESTRIKKDISEFQKIIFTGRQGLFTLEWEQYYMIKNGKAYVLTFTTTAAQFDNDKNEAEEIMNSFEVK